MMKIKAMRLSHEFDRAARDRLYDLVSELGIDAFVDQYVDSIYEWKSEKDRRMRRFKWALSVIHTRDELLEICRERLGFFRLNADQFEPLVAAGESIDIHDADVCDTILFGELNLAWGEEMGVADFDSRAEAEAFGESLSARGLRWTSYGEDGTYYVVWDNDPSD